MNHRFEFLNSAAMMKLMCLSLSSGTKVVAPAGPTPLIQPLRSSQTIRPRTQLPSGNYALAFSLSSPLLVNRCRAAESEESCDKSAANVSAMP